MKKLLFASLLAAAVSAAKPSLAGVEELAAGAQLVPYAPFRWSLDVLVRPATASIVYPAVLGAVLNSGKSVKHFRGENVTLAFREATFLVGYWTNKNKESVLGWHIYFGIGLSGVDALSQRFTSTSSFVAHNVVGLGAAIYEPDIRPISRYVSSLTAEAVFVDRRGLALRNRTEAADTDLSAEPVDGSEVVLRVGYRIWFR